MIDWVLRAPQACIQSDLEMDPEIFNPAALVPPATVVLADPDETYRDLARVILEREGYVVRAFATDKEMADVLRRGPVDLLILEYLLPGASIDDIVGSIRENPRTSRLPVLVVTSVRKVEAQVLAMDMGADGWLSKPYESRVLLAHVRSLVRLKRLNDETEHFESVLASLSSAVEAKDPYTRGHSERVSALSTLIASEMGMSNQEQLLMRRAGLVHDIGKLVVDLSFIHKPGKLDDHEWEIMRTHPEAGARICAPLKSALPLIPLVRHHHEKLNGKGYPDGLVEDQISPAVRVISVADVYDALTTSRPYRAALTHVAAMDILNREVKDGAWDSDVVSIVDRIGEEAYGSRT